MTPRPVDRVRIVPGSRLQARDLRDLVAFESARRAEHVRDVHATWGVGVGFAVAVMHSGWAVLVGPGIAYDCAGGEIVLSHTVLLEIPEGSGWVDLAVARWPDTALTERESLCRGERDERPAFRWSFVDAADAPPSLSLRIGESVPLARIAVGESGVADLGFRRGVRSAARPRVVAGSVPFRPSTSPSAMCWTMSVDTSAAAFASTPAYHATVRPTDVPSSFLGPFVSIANASAAGFDLTVRFAVELLVLESPAPKAPDLDVDWLGVELARGCWPDLDVSGAFALLEQRRHAELIALPSLGNLVTKELDGIDA